MAVEGVHSTCAYKKKDECIEIKTVQRTDKTENVRDCLDYCVSSI